MLELPKLGVIMDADATLFEPAYPVAIEITGHGHKVALLLDARDLQSLAQAVDAVRGHACLGGPITEDSAEEALLKGSPLEPILLRMDMEQVRKSGGLRVARLLVGIGQRLRFEPFESHIRLGLSRESLEKLQD
jgi:hypothetical protein